MNELQSKKLAFFEGLPVSKGWDVEQEKWQISIVDIGHKTFS